VSKLFNYGKFSTVSIMPKNNGLKNYGDYKKKIIEDLKRHIEIIEDPCKLKLDGENKDPPFILEISTVSDDLSIIELTLRCKRKMFDFGNKGEKFFKFVVPIESRDENTVRALRIKLLNELIEKVEDDEYKTLIKTFLRNH
jgi:DNA repair photolyase